MKISSVLIGYPKNLDGRGEEGLQATEQTFETVMASACDNQNTEYMKVEPV